MGIEITRRSFLIQALLAGAAVSTPSFLHAQPGNPFAGKKVIVIGAGLAGLCTALQLKEMGFNVVVFEAQDRVGGRVRTLRNPPFSNDLFAEAGAFWFCENHLLTLDYIRQFDLELFEMLKPGYRMHYFLEAVGTPVSVANPSEPTSGLPDALRPKPTDIPVNDWPKLREDERGLGMWKLLGRYVCHRPELLDTTAPSWPSRKLHQALIDLDDIPFDQFMETLGQPLQRQASPGGASPGAKDLIRPWFAWWDDVDKVSALSLLRDGAATRQMCTDAHQKWYTLKDGMDGLPEAFAGRLSGAIFLNTPVTRIVQDQTKRAVMITYRDGGRELTYTGDFLVSAIPFSVLRSSVDLEAAQLSEDKRRTIHELEYASVARVYLQCRRRVWNKGAFNGVMFTDLKSNALRSNAMVCGMNLLDMTVAQPGAQGILQAYMVGTLAREVGKMSMRDRVEFFQKTIKTKVYPDIETIGEGASIYWDAEPWAKGAYAMFRPKKMMEQVPFLASAEGRIHFAGDHTSGRPGWMEGALQSGVRAAREIAKQASLEAVQQS